MATEPLKSSQPIFVPVPEDLPEDFDLRELGYRHQSVRLPDGSTRSAYVVPAGLGAADSGTPSPPAAPAQNYPRTTQFRKAQAVARPPVLVVPPKFNLQEQLLLWQAKLNKRFQTAAFAQFRLFSLLGLAALFVASFILWTIAQTIAAPSEVRVQITYRSQLEGQKQLTASPLIFKTVETQLIIEEALAPTGVTLVPDQKASGQIRISNTTERGLGLNAGTLIATVNGVGYRLTQNVSVPGSNFATGQLGSVVATIQADKAGTVGNLPNGLGTLNLAQGLKAAGISPLAGGTMREAKIVSKTDLENLRQKLEAQLATRATESMATKVDSGWQLLEATQSPTIAEVATAFNLPEGAEAEAVSGKLTARLTMPVYNPGAIAEQLMAETSAPVGGITNLSLTGRDSPSGPPSLLPTLPQPLYGKITVKQISVVAAPAAGAETQLLNVNYSQALNPPNLQKMLDGWATSGRANMDKLLLLLQQRPDVELVKMTVMEPQKTNFKLKVFG